jgi:hypothetical protein
MLPFAESAINLAAGKLTARQVAEDITPAMVDQFGGDWLLNKTLPEED